MPLGDGFFGVQIELLIPGLRLDRRGYWTGTRIASPVATSFS
jgi:hypothetical protein